MEEYTDDSSEAGSSQSDSEPSPNAINTFSILLEALNSLGDDPLNFDDSSSNDSLSSLMSYQPDLVQFSLSSRSNSPDMFEENSNPSTHTDEDEIELEQPEQESSSEQDDASNEPVIVAPVSVEAEKLSPKRKRENSVSPNRKRRKSDSSDGENDAQTCSICFEHWTSEGEHRICSLKCGHLFGKKCITRWISTQTRKTCPTCKASCAMRDIRLLYAKNVRVNDELLVKDLNEKIAKMKQEHEKEVERWKGKCSKLEIMLEQERLGLMQQKVSKSSTPTDLEYQIKLISHLKMQSPGRVMAYNSNNLLVVAVKITTQPFNGFFGIRKINTTNYKDSLSIPLHNNTIRDLAFHPQTGELLLSVSHDKTAKITNVETNAVVHTFPTESELWSCCWDVNKPNIFYVGNRKGVITQFDLSDRSSIREIRSTTGMAGIISIVSTEPYPNASSGSLVCAAVNKCWAFEFNDGDDYKSKEIQLAGPFVSLKYNKVDKKFLITTRTNSRRVSMQHIVCNLEQSTTNDEQLDVNVIHSFAGGTQSTHLVRDCYMVMPNNLPLVAYYQETSKRINIRDENTGNLLHMITSVDLVYDMCFIETNQHLVILNEREIKIFSIK